jgi:hypothetical protein
MCIRGYYGSSILGEMQSQPIQATAYRAHLKQDNMNTDDYDLFDDIPPELNVDEMQTFHVTK